MKIFKKPNRQYPLWKYALLHALFYSSVSTIFAFILILILSATPIHLKLAEDWIIFGVIIAITFIAIFIYVFLDEYYIEKKYKEEKQSDLTKDNQTNINNTQIININPLEKKKSKKKAKF